MKSAKERKMEKKRRAKATNARKTDASRQRRLDNKAKRAAITKIDPNIKVNIIDQITYDSEGTRIKIENKKIVKWLPLESTPDEVTEDVIEKIEIRNKSALHRLADKIKRIK